MRSMHALNSEQPNAGREDTGQDPSICSARIREMASLPAVLRSFRVD